MTCGLAGVSQLLLCVKKHLQPAYPLKRNAKQTCGVLPDRGVGGHNSNILHVAGSNRVYGKYTSNWISIIINKTGVRLRLSVISLVFHGDVYLEY